MWSEDVELLEIERELGGPGKQAALARYDAVLVGLKERLARALRMGLPPEEYARAEGLDEVVTIARKLLRLQVRGEETPPAAVANAPDWRNARREDVSVSLGEAAEKIGYGTI